ncbi:MAG TPA: hypothetical protein VMX36_12085 [Sedimentisphaerales bacterium]|nr:hypothetical protein [Sedimentisphaerales bacterium]
MFKKMTCLVSLVLPLVMLNSASALIFWDAEGFDDLWSTAVNWDTNTIPTRTDPVSIDYPDNMHCQIKDGITALCETLRVANSGSTTNLDISGGSLTASGAYIGVDEPTGHGILNMSGGVFSTGSLQLGWSATGTLNMTGGTINLSDNLQVPGLNGTGTVNLLGGTINASELQLTSASGTMNITTGVLVLEGDDTATVQTYIDDGWITAYKGQSRLNLDYNVTNPGKTTLSATALLNPVPADGATVAPGEVVLSWTSLDPCVPGQPVQVDVYFTDDLKLLEEFTDPAAITIVSKQNVTSIAVQTESKKQYYWAVDTYVGSDADPVYGPIFSFSVDNIPPRVNAGADIATWLQDGTRTGDLDATVTDEEDCFLMWSVVSEPNEGTAVIENGNSEDPNVTLSAVGEYVLQLLAFDGEYRGSDTVTINVYNDSCQAAQSLPDYVPILGDLNGDCKVDDADLALLEENWLKDNSLTDDWHKIE